MKFIRKEYIITTIFDKELTKEEEIKIVFDNLYAHRIEFSMIVKKVTPSYDDFKMTHERVRILKLYDDKTCDLMILKKGANMSMKKVPFADIIEINAVTKKYRILDVDSDVNKIDLLDIKGEDE